jgi:hypothetical protein
MRKASRSHAVGRRLDEVHESPQRRGHEALARVVEERSREALPPGFEDGFEGAAVDMRAQPVLEEVRDAGAADRRFGPVISSYCILSLTEL